MQRADELKKKLEATELFYLTPPMLVQDIRAGAFSSLFTITFIQLLVLACGEKGKPYLHIRHKDLAWVLGCSLRTAMRCVYEAQKLGYCDITALFRRLPPEGEAGIPLRCHCGHTAEQHDGACKAARCPCPRWKPLQHRQLANAYAPGVKLTGTWGHFQALRRAWAARRATGAGPSRIATPGDPTARSTAIYSPPTPSPEGGGGELPLPTADEKQAAPRPAPPRAPRVRRRSARCAEQRAAPGCAPPTPAGRDEATAEPIEAGCKKQAAASPTPGGPAQGPAPRPDPPPAEITPRQLHLVLCQPGAAVQVRMEVYLEMRSRGASPAEIEDALVRLSAAQEEAKGGPPGAVCLPQRAPPRPWEPGPSGPGHVQARDALYHGLRAAGAPADEIAAALAALIAEQEREEAALAEARGVPG